jgi:hypothetical protein
MSSSLYLTVIDRNFSKSRRSAIRASFLGRGERQGAETGRELASILPEVGQLVVWDIPSPSRVDYGRSRLAHRHRAGSVGALFRGEIRHRRPPP